MKNQESKLIGKEARAISSKHLPNNKFKYKSKEKEFDATIVEIIYEISRNSRTQIKELVLELTNPKSLKHYVRVVFNVRYPYSSHQEQRVVVGTLENDCPNNIVVISESGCMHKFDLIDIVQMYEIKN